MRIASNTVSEEIVAQIQRLGAQQAKWQSQVASGQRIAAPADDPAAAGRVLALQSEQRRVAQYQDNAARALQVSEASFSGLNSIKSVSDRASQIGTLGTGALNASQTQAYGAELNQLVEQVLQLANSKFGDDYLYAGTATAAPPFTATRDAGGHITSVAYVGNSDRAAIPLSETATVTPNTSGAINVGLGDFLNQLVALRDALNAGDPTAVGAAATAMAPAEDMLVSALAEHGGMQARIEANQSQQKDRGTDLEKLVSDEVDADLPSTVVKLTQSQTAYQAALQSAASIMNLSLLDYIR